MNRHGLSITLAIGLTLCAALPAEVRAQPPGTHEHQQRLAAFPAVKEAIVKAIGAESSVVELNATRNRFIVTLVNGKLNEGTSAGRENEASAIAAIVSKAIADKPQFKGIIVIHIEYVRRQSDGAKARVVDAIEFRKDADGLFRHHMT